MYYFKGTIMKKLWVLAGSVLLFFSCSTGVGTVFDDSIPVEQTAQIYTYRVGSITAYNGITVNWQLKISAKSIQIPAGDTLLVWDVMGDRGYTRYRGKNLEFRYNFQPQKKYYLLLNDKYDEAEGTVTYGIDVYTYEINEKITNNTGPHFTEFVPFLNQRKL